VGVDLPPRIRTVKDVDADRAALGIPDFLLVGNAEPLGDLRWRDDLCWR
jgi:hypothetical protein